MNPESINLEAERELQELIKIRGLTDVEAKASVLAYYAQYGDQWAEMFYNDLNAYAKLIGKRQ